jgi:hypothetical protein
MLSVAIFGKKPMNAIFLPDRPYAVRFNCQAGQLALSEDEFLSKEAEISIIACKKWYGSLGKTKDAEWLQLFFIPAPSCQFLPRNTVCVSYIKTRSLSQFHQLITKLLAEDTNTDPAEGIFKVSFLSHTNAEGQPYKSVKFDWRERKTEEEIAQLEQIAQFLAGKPTLQDLEGTKNMIPFSEYAKLASAN